MQLSSAPRVATTRSGWCAAIWVSTASSPARHRWCTWGCAEPSATAEGQELWVIVNHWKSKSQDTPEVQYTLPRRIEQATFVAGLVQEILAADPDADLIVLGDLNDFLNSEPMSILTDAGLSDLLPEVSKSA